MLRHRAVNFGAAMTSTTQPDNTQQVGPKEDTEKVVFRHGRLEGMRPSIVACCWGRGRTAAAAVDWWSCGMHTVRADLLGAEFSPTRCGQPCSPLDGRGPGELPV